jgi:hypothetical protein
MLTHGGSVWTLNRDREEADSRLHEDRYTLMLGEARNSLSLHAVSNSGGSYETNMVVGTGTDGVLARGVRRSGLLRERTAAPDAG